VGWNAVLEEVKFVDCRAVKLAAECHKWNPKEKTKKAKSWPKLVAIARAFGWDGDTSSPSQPTFVGPEALC
jgi:hypothetical protein